MVVSSVTPCVCCGNISKAELALRFTNFKPAFSQLIPDTGEKKVQILKTERDGCNGHTIVVGQGAEICGRYFPFHTPDIIEASRQASSWHEKVECKIVSKALAFWQALITFFD